MSTRGFCYDDDVPDLPWRSYAAWLRKRHGCRLWRVAVDAGFSCPHRAGGRSGEGCSFCAGEGGRAPYLGEIGRPAYPGDLRAVRQQVELATAILRRRYRAEAFLLYFQAYTGTYAATDELARLWSGALQLAPFLELIVATRPDCFDAEKAELLASYRSRGLEVWVELGLQSASDLTLRRVQRGHTVADFCEAARLARKRGLLVAAHVILGLPGESLDQMLDTARLLARLGVDGVKLHDLHVVRGTPLAREHLAGELAAAGASSHLERVVSFLELLPSSAVIMRLSCDTPVDRLVAPRRSIDKASFTRELASEMRRRGTWQGRCFSGDLDPVSRLL